ncbi:MAG: hypothetical protein ACRDMX_08065 [Solirubrobacteraceae bacterium]
MSAQAKTGEPEFAISIRGYDRVQVDEHIARLHSLLDETEARARSAEADPDPHLDVGPRVTEIFELAVAEAKELRDRARAESQRVMADSRERAEALTDGARREAAALTSRAEREHAELMAELERERDEARAELVSLEQSRVHLLAELRGIHDALGGVAGLGQDEPTAVLPPAPTEEQPVVQELDESPSEPNDEDPPEPSTA